jgi:hypothetical protein
MAGKSRRVASRQGELGRRRKRGQRGPAGVPTAPDSPQSQLNGGAAAVASDTVESTASSPATHVPAAATAQAAPTASRPASQSGTQSRGQVRLRGERPAAYNYVGAELRRIGVLSTVVVAALIVIAVVL